MNREELILRFMCRPTKHRQWSAINFEYEYPTYEEAEKMADEFINKIESKPIRHTVNERND